MCSDVNFAYFSHIVLTRSLHWIYYCSISFLYHARGKLTDSIANPPVGCERVTFTYVGALNNCAVTVKNFFCEMYADVG